MPRRPVYLFAAFIAAGLLAGCPDPKGPGGPTTPKVPEPKAQMAPGVVAALLSSHRNIPYLKENS